MLCFSPSSAVHAWLENVGQVAAETNTVSDIDDDGGFSKGNGNGIAACISKPLRAKLVHDLRCAAMKPSANADFGHESAHRFNPKGAGFLDSARIPIGISGATEQAVAVSLMFASPSTRTVPVGPRGCVTHRTCR